MLLAALAGCALLDAPASAVRAGADLARREGAPIASIAGLAAARLDGAWVPRLGRAPFAAGPVVLSAAEGGTALDWTGANGITTRLRAVAPGRFLAPGAASGDALWVLWIDADDRTVMLGSPSGRSLVVLDRDATGGADRMTAARRIALFYGFAADRLAGAA